MNSNESPSGRLPLPVVIALAVIMAFAVITMVQWVLASLFSLLRVGLVAAAIVTLVLWVISAKAKR